MDLDFASAWLGRLMVMVMVVIGGGLGAHGQILVSTNAVWSYRKGLAEPSVPPAAWRAEGYDDHAWTSGRAPFYYDTESAYRGDTELADMRQSYTTLYLRRDFVAAEPLEDLGSLALRFLCDDGFALWINGQLVTHYNHGGEDYAFSAIASANAPEPIAWLGTTIPGPFPFLHAGTNTVAVQAFNVSRTSSDFVFDLELIATATDRRAPTVVSVDPPPGIVTSLNSVIVTFSEAVTGIGFSDLLINQRPATGMSGSGAVYTFTWEPLPEGVAEITWDAGAGIADFAHPPNRFDGPASRWAYTVVDRQGPEIVEVNPPPSSTVRGLDQLELRFNEAVVGVEAADLLINGEGATSLTGSEAGPYLFRFAAPAAGVTRVSWRSDHSILDRASIPNTFAGASWDFTVDPNFVVPTVRINEWLAGYSGDDGLRDEDDELQDWIELENLTDSAVNLVGWSLTDDPGDPGQWIFPDTVIAPGGFLIVFASGKDRRPVDPQRRRHANFKLGVEGEYLGLYSPESPRRVVSEIAPEYPALRPDVSGGVDTQDRRRIFAVPTPGVANRGESLEGVVPPVVFSVGRGVFDQSFELRLSCVVEDAEIRYTTDGSEPGAETGLRYTGPLAVNKTQVVRAAAFKSGSLASPSVTHSYLFPADTIRQSDQPAGFPSQWIDTQGRAWTADYGMDPEIVNAPAYQDRIVDSLKSLPAISLVAKPADLFDNATGIYPKSQARGPSWERPASMEIIGADGDESVQVNCGVQMQGNSVRDPVKTAKHSFRLVFKGDYGPSKWRHQLFPDAPVDEFDTLILRADFNNSWMHWNGAQRIRGQRIRDAWMKDSQRAMGGLASHSRFFHLYVNGLYWGVYDATERPDAAFASAYLGGAKEDFDVVNEGQIVDGNMTAYNAMRAVDNLASDTQYALVKEYLDVPAYIDHVLLHFYAGHEDWFTDKNWYAIRRRDAGQGFRYLPWDGEMILSTPDVNIVGRADQPSDLHPKLRLNAQYRLDFADRIQRHFFAGGALTAEVAAARYDRWASHLASAMVAESARWGDYRRDVHAYSSGPYVLYTVDEHFAKERTRLMTEFFPGRTRAVLGQLRAAGLYPSTVAPEFNQQGGPVIAGFGLTMTAPAGTILFTTNGVDPRAAFSGLIASDAQVYQGALTLRQPMLVKARARVGAEWSALSEAAFEVGELRPSLVFTEIQYRPAGGSPYEFVEIANIGEIPMDIGGFALEGIRHLFPVGTVLPPGAVLVLASSLSPVSFAQRYPGVRIAGYFEGELANGGERLALLDRNGDVVCSVTYRADHGWPDLAVQPGASMELVAMREDPGAPASWRASKAAGGTPGAAPPRNSLPGVRFNELLVLAPESDNGQRGSDWVELINGGPTEVDLSGWQLTDHGGSSPFVFPAGTRLPSGGFQVVWCDGQPSSGDDFHAAFSMDSEGETVSLFDAVGERVDAVSFGAQAAGFSLVRLGQDPAWSVGLPTPGSGNVAQITAGPEAVRVNEWSANASPQGDDWIEFHNTSELPADLRGGWVALNGVGFQLKSPAFVGPRGFVVLAADGHSAPGHLDFRLPAVGGVIELFERSVERVDRVAYAHHNEGMSEGRWPDGGDEFRVFHSPTPGAGNASMVLRRPLLQILAANAEPWSLQIQGTAGYLHRLETSTDLGTWQELGTTVPTTATFTWTLPSSKADPARYFRVVVSQSGSSP
jgi:hypothetical protein